MSETQGTARTPGPWHVGMNPGPIVYGPKGEQIVDCRSVFSDRPEWIQNARLIAAAPELLSVLQEFLADQETLNEPYRNEAICERARAALAKAGVS